MPLFRVSYSFTDQIAGDQNTIRKAIRDLSFSTAFAPEDLNLDFPLGVEGLLTNPITPGGQHGREANPAPVHGRVQGASR